MGRSETGGSAYSLGLSTVASSASSASVLYFELFQPYEVSRVRSLSALLADSNPPDEGSLASAGHPLITTPPLALFECSSCLIATRRLGCGRQPERGPKKKKLFFRKIREVNQ